MIERTAQLASGVGSPVSVARETPFTPVLLFCRVPGRVLLAIWLSAAAFPLAGLTGKTLDFAVYGVIGLVTPLFVFGVSRRDQSAGTPTTHTDLITALLCFGGACLFLSIVHNLCVLLFSILQAIVWRRAGANGAVNLVCQGLVATVSWAAAMLLPWWDDSWVTGSRQAVLVTVSAALLVAIEFAPRQRTERVPFFVRFGRLADLGALIFLSLLAFRTDWLYTYLPFYHWGVYIGPVEMVRQGGWLLWDVPSQYGFLSTLTLAALPFRSAWEGLYVINGLFLLMTSGFLFLLFRRASRGFLNWLFATLMTAAAVFMITGYAQNLHGPQGTPSVGAFRFFWCYALTALLVLHYRSRESGKGVKRCLVIGTVIWLMGVLWAAESALYCTALWLPAFCWLAWRRYRASAGHWTSFARWAALPPAVLALAVAGIDFWYWLRLGHGPDWQAYSEYVLSFGRGFGSLPLDPAGSVWVLLIVFLAVAAALAGFLQSRFRDDGTALCLAMLGVLWATASYFVGRSHPNNVDNLIPIVCLAIAVVTRLLWDRGVDVGVGGLVRAAFVPILAVVIGCTWGNAAEFPHWWRTTLTVPQTNVESLLPNAEPQLSQILEAGGVKPGDPLVYVAPYLMPSVRLNGRIVPESAFKAWLPLGPLDLHNPISRARTVVYMERFASRSKRDGWLIQPLHPTANGVVENEDPLFAQIARTHTALRSLSNGDYRLTWYVYRGNEAH